MQLYPLQHDGRLADLIGRQWRDLTEAERSPGGDVTGPYLQAPPANPFNKSTTVVAERQARETDGWTFRVIPGKTRLDDGFVIKVVLPRRFDAAATGLNAEEVERPR